MESNVPVVIPDASLAGAVAAPRVRSFEGWKVLITGGSSGIGFALAEALIREGANVCIAARDSARLAQACGELAKQVRAHGQAPTYVTLDVTSASDLGEAMARAVATLGGIDLLINNAGYAQTGYFDALPDDVFTNMMAVNYFGPMRLCRAALPYFRAQGYGRIVNVTSMLGFMGTFGYSAYCASKHALAGFTECLRQDLLPFNIRVHLAYPPTTLTPGLERENADKPPEAWAIEGKSKAFTKEQVAAAMLSGMRRGKFHLLAGFDSWFIWVVQRVAPWLVRRVTDAVLLKSLRERPELPSAAGVNRLRTR
jgi:NAD(P)-dependent dehydrogenase (short-subunit alcohol dehydrogenase family)